MKKDDILNASRKEHKNKDLAEIEVIYQAGSHAGRVWLVRFIKMKRKSDLVLTILFLILSVLAFAGFIRRLLEVRV